MKSEILSNSDWMSPKLNLVDQNTQPRTSDKVSARCLMCCDIFRVVYRDLIRSTNKHLAMGLCGYHCKKCLHSTEQYKIMHRNNSIRSLDKITNGASDRSRKLWEQKDYRIKMEANHARLRTDENFASKISDTIKNKFIADRDYVAKVNASRRNDSDDFISRCDEVHDFIYDYSKTVYVGVDVKFDIICDKHGVFSQLPSNHLRGHGCPACANDRSKLSNSEFIDRCVNIHGDKYDYSNTEYVSSLDNITYRCPKHGMITQLAQNHVKGRGCRFCDAEKTSSAGEQELADFISSFVDIRRNVRDLIDNSEIDIVIDSMKIGVEYHGLYWHSFNRKETKNEKYRHYDKLSKMLDIGYSLIQVYENEWISRKEVVKSMIIAKLGLINNKYHARKCDAIVCDEKTAADFFNNNHLHGHRKSMMYIGLVYNNEIVAMASFSVLNGRCELIRFCNKLNSVVVGGLSKIIKKSGYDNIFTYVDRRYSSLAASYSSVGFECIGVTVPGYCYVLGQRVFARQKFQKHKLVGVIDNFDQTLTESENMFNNGYRRIWDAGNYKMMWRR